MRTVIALSLLLISFSPIAAEATFEEVKILSMDSSDAAVKLVKKGDSFFILKQIVDADPDEQFLLVRDFVASQIAEKCGIPMNKVSFIHAEEHCPAKFYADRAATIHTVAPGKSIEDAFPEFLPQNFSLHQRICNPDSPWQQKNPLKEEDQGLTVQIITSMALHEDLPKIAAFDTFVGNADRSRPNIFHDKQNNRFCGIDNAAAFNNKNLAESAKKRLEELSISDYQCKKIRDGLEIYIRTLLDLIEKIDIENIEADLVSYAVAVGCSPERGKFHARAFAANVNSVENLISEAFGIYIKYFKSKGGYYTGIKTTCSDAFAQQP